MGEVRRPGDLSFRPRIRQVRQERGVIRLYQPLSVAFFKSGIGPQTKVVDVSPSSPEGLTAWVKQAQSTCQSCGRRMSLDATGVPACKTASCPNAASE